MYLGGSNGLLPFIPGGSTNTTLFSDTWASDDDGESWQKMADGPWAGREGMSGQTGVVLADDSLVIAGGEQGYFPR